MKNYQLAQSEQKKSNVKDLTPYLKEEVWKMLGIFMIILVNSMLDIASPFLLGLTIDQAITEKSFEKLLQFCSILLVIYLCSIVTNYFQVKLMGNLGQRLLLKLRTNLFAK